VNHNKSTKSVIKYWESQLVNIKGKTGIIMNVFWEWIKMDRNLCLQLFILYIFLNTDLQILNIFFRFTQNFFL
jgi:hypothetical protein